MVFQYGGGSQIMSSVEDKVETGLCKDGENRLSMSTMKQNIVLYTELISN